MSIYIYCEECKFEMESADMKEAQHMLTDKEGALVSDGKGGYLSICPSCKEETLAFEN